MVPLLLSAVLLVQPRPGRLHEAVAAGLLAGYAGAVKPANYLFLAGAGAAFVLARRWRERSASGSRLHRRHSPS